MFELILLFLRKNTIFINKDIKFRDDNINSLDSDIADIKDNNSEIALIVNSLSYGIYTSHHDFQVNYTPLPIVHIQDY